MGMIYDHTPDKFIQDLLENDQAVFTEEEFSSFLKMGKIKKIIFYDYVYRDDFVKETIDYFIYNPTSKISFCFLSLESSINMDICDLKAMIEKIELATLIYEKNMLCYIKSNPDQDTDIIKNAILILI